jgi:transcriptional regulator with XRE-family HTH domain
MDPDAPTLRELRERAELSQTAVATFTKVAQATVSGWEYGRLTVPEDRRAPLRQVLGCDAEELEAALAQAVTAYETGLDTRLSDQIRALRVDRGLTQEQVAEATDVTTGAVAMWERGSNQPSPERLEALADVFELTPEELLASAGWDAAERAAVLDRPERAETPVAALLREARTTAGLNQEQVAAALGVAQNSVSAMETAHYSPNAETWERLIKLYDLDPRDVAVAVFQTRQLTGVVPEVNLPWPLDPITIPRPRWLRQVRAHLGCTRGELGELLGVAGSVIATAERPDSGLPTGLRPSATLQALAELAGSDEVSLRRAWQPDEVAGIEHLLGRPITEQLEEVERMDQFLRAQSLAGLSQTAIADAAGVTREAARQWIAGGSVPSTAKLATLAAFLGVELERLEALRHRTKHPVQQAPPGGEEDTHAEPSDPDRIFDALG